MPVKTLSEILKEKIKIWRGSNYDSQYPAISEILNFNLYEDESGNKNLRFLRKA